MRAASLPFVVAVCCCVSAAIAQPALLPYVGYNLDAASFLVGLGSEFETPIEAGPLSLAVRPSLEYLFAGERVRQDVGGSTVETSSTFLQLNGDVIARLNAMGVEPFVGIGLALSYASDNVDCEGSGAVCDAPETYGLSPASSTDVGLNLLGGLRIAGALGFATPFVEGRLTLAEGTVIDGHAVSLFGGLMIPLDAE